MRARSEKPLFVKLPPFTTDVERDVVLALAPIAQEAGASGLTCSNTRPVHEPRLSVGGGGLSGRALWERTPSIVADVRAATGGVLPINACGGIATVDDVLTCLEAGAATVQVYSALIFEGPASSERSREGSRRAPRAPLVRPRTVRGLRAGCLTTVPGLAATREWRVSVAAWMMPRWTTCRAPAGSVDVHRGSRRPCGGTRIGPVGRGSSPASFCWA